MRRLAVTLALLLITLAAQAATTMPPLIPTPPWDIDATVESVYGDANYYTHWVDNTHPSSTDTSNPNGSPSVPRKTIPSTSALAAGSVVQIRGGPYTATGEHQVNGPGTVAQPIFLCGPEVGDRPEIHKHFRVTSGSYIYICNLLVSQVNENHLEIRRAADVTVSNIVFRNNRLIGDGVNAGAGAGITISGGAYSTPLANICTLRNEVSDMGDRFSLTENDKHGIGVGSNQTNLWHLYNTSYHNAGDGIGNADGANQTTSYVYIGGNTFYENRENAIDLKECHQTIISKNTCYNFYPSSSSSEGAAIVVHADTPTSEAFRDGFICYNTIHDSKVAIISTGIVNTNWWFGNVIYDCETGINPDRGGGVFKVYNNTIYGCTNYGINVEGTIAKLDLRNNLVRQMKGAGAYHMRIVDSVVRGNTTVFNENYGNDDGTVKIGWSSDYTSVAAWVAAAGKGTGSIQTNPLFVDAGGNNFAIGGGSSCIDVGYAVTDFATDFGNVMGFSAGTIVDVAGVARPNNSSWDIGAYEYEWPAPGGTTYLPKVIGRGGLTGKGRL